jgi:hypothetical protein
MAGIGHPGAEILRKAEAPPDVRAVLEDIQDVMSLPWFPSPWAGYAVRPAVLRLFWSHLREITLNELFVREALAIAGAVHMGAASWYRPTSGVRLEEIARAEPSLQRELDAFEFGLPQLLIQQSALSHLLRGQTVGQAGRIVARAVPGPHRHPDIGLPAWEDLSKEPQSAARQLAQAWSLPRMPEEALALAKWPRFLAHGWRDLKALRMRPEYRSLRRRVADMGEDALGRLRPEAEIPAGDVRSALEEGGDWPGGLDSLKDQVLSFTLILPGMILDNALLRMAAAAWRHEGKGQA